MAAIHLDKVMHVDVRRCWPERAGGAYGYEAVHVRARHCMFEGDGCMNEAVYVDTRCC